MSVELLIRKTGELLREVASRLDSVEEREVGGLVLKVLAETWQAGYEEAVRQHDEEGGFLTRRPNALAKASKGDA